MHSNLRPGIVEIEVLDWEEMKRFYCEVLGLDVLTIEDDHGYAWLCGSPIIVSLKRVDSRDSKARGGISLQFVVDDIENAISGLESKGCHFARKELDAAQHYRAAYFFDPEGNALAIYQLT